LAKKKLATSEGKSKTNCKRETRRLQKDRNPVKIEFCPQKAEYNIPLQTNSSRTQSVPAVLIGKRGAQAIRGRGGLGNSSPHCFELWQDSRNKNNKQEKLRGPK